MPTREMVTTWVLGIIGLVPLPGLLFLTFTGYHNDASPIGFLLVCGLPILGVVALLVLRSRSKQRLARVGLLSIAVLYLLPTIAALVLGSLAYLGIVTCGEVTSIC